MNNKRKNPIESTIRHYKKQKKTSKLTFTCSKLTIEALQKGVKYVQS